MHVVVVGCGRVGSALARNLTEAGHTVAIIDKRPEAFGRLADRLHRPGHRRHRLRPGSPDGGGHRAGGRRRGGHQRRQLEHPHRPRRPRDLRHRATWSPASTTLAGPRSTSAWASPPWRRWRGRPSGSCAASCPARPPWSGSTPVPGSRIVERSIAAVVVRSSDLRPRGAGTGAGGGRRPPREWPRSPTRTSSPRTGMSSTWPWPATRVAALDTTLAAGPAKGGH